MDKTDIFQPGANVGMTDAVCILGSGPTLTPMLNEWVGPTIIGCNRTGIYGDIWVVADRRAVETEWFHDIDAKFDKSPRATRIWQRDIANRSKHFRPEKDYTFRLHPKYDVTGKFIMPHNSMHQPVDYYGYLRPDESVIGCAMCIAYIFGAKKMVLAGVDMSGDTYYTGETRKPGGDPKSGGERWGFTDALNRLCWWMMSQGIDVRTATDTKLFIPKLGDVI